jgi:glycosyltransferase involved in cell wall biosynthesis
VRVAIIADPYVPIPPTAYGGTELVIFNLIKGLKEMGHHPILIGPGDSTVDCEIIPTVRHSLNFPKNKKDYPAFKKKIAEIEKKTKKLIQESLSDVDVIHSHGFDIKDFADFPNVYTLHNPFILNSKATNTPTIDYFVDRKKLNYVSISDNQRQALPRLNYIATIYNGENPDDFPFVEDPEDYVCFLGRFDREKNPHLAIELAINKGIKIKLAGKVDYMGNDYFDEEVKKYFNHPLVEYLGELGFKDKVDLISNAKCNLHPTGFREPFGLVVLEAAYCGTPTMAIARGSMPELIREGDTGMLVEDFVEGLWGLGKCFKMDRGYISRRSRKKFNYLRMTKGYVRAYHKALRVAKKGSLVPTS